MVGAIILHSPLVKTKSRLGAGIRRRGQTFLQIATSNFPPILDLSERLFIADPISQAIGFGSGPTPPSLRSLIIQYFGILLSGVGWCELMDQANRPKVV